MKSSVLLFHLTTVTLYLLIFQIQPTKESSLGGALYDDHDKITLLNSTNFQSTICGSSTAWLVEFYSSWCGHCIHFAPTFKQLALDVHSCREYEVMGYPTIKFFSPHTLQGDMGTEEVKQ